MKAPSKRTVYFDPKDIGQLDRINLANDRMRYALNEKEGLVGVINSKGKVVGQAKFSSSPVVGHHPLEFFEGGGHHMGNQITSISKKK